MKRDPFMPSPEAIRRAENFLKALSEPKDWVGRFMFGAYAVGIIVLGLVALAWTP